MQDLSCNSFIELLASKEPVPGGGGACAFVGALGTALGCMVGNLTLGKKKYADIQEDIKRLIDTSGELIERFKKLVDRDAEVFFPLSKAYGLPATNDIEINEKNRVMQSVLYDASMVPLEIARACKDTANLLEKFCEKGTRIAISDVAVGAAFCIAAVRGAKLNVLINTRLIKDESIKNIMVDIQPYSSEEAKADYGYTINCTKRMFCNLEDIKINTNFIKYKSHDYEVIKIIGWDDYMEILLNQVS
jgi:formiminotetrahydrofolate cyclodeaminase